MCKKCFATDNVMRVEVVGVVVVVAEEKTGT